MVNEPLLPSRFDPGKTSNLLKNLHFPDWHGFRSDFKRTAGLGELGGLQHPQTAWEGRLSDH
jgi:hypothetical protein